MSAEQVFSLANSLALISWLALVFLPRARWVTRYLTSLVVPGLLALTYIALIGSHWGGSEGGFGSLAAVAQLFSNPWLLLAGWIHYLAFDLLIGTWETRDAAERGVPHLLVVPCLALTFLLGPAGWLAYQGVRRVAAKNQNV